MSFSQHLGWEWPRLPLRVVDALTVSGAALCCLAAILAALHVSFGLVGMLFLVGSAVDAIDGRLARAATSQARPRGAFLDATCDKIGEGAMLVGVALRSSDVILLRVVLLAAVLGLLTSYCKTLANELGISANWHYARVWGRTFRVLILGVGLVLTEISRADGGLLLTLLALALFNAVTLFERLARVASLK